MWSSQDPVLRTLPLALAQRLGRPRRQQVRTAESKARYLAWLSNSEVLGSLRFAALEQISLGSKEVGLFSSSGTACMDARNLSDPLQGPVRSSATCVWVAKLGMSSKTCSSCARMSRSTSALRKASRVKRPQQFIKMKVFGNFRACVQ